MKFVRVIIKTDFRLITGDQRGMENRQTVLCWQVTQLLMCNGYFWLKSTDKMLHNQKPFSQMTVR